MKANVMIGDWVEYRFTGWTEKDGVYKDYQYVQISSIGQLYIKADNDRVASADGEEFYPIPLTSEILEKNGFKWNTYHTSQDLVCGTIHLGYGFYKGCISASDWDENGNVQIVSLKCEYVHELQHILRLCEINKEIIL